MAELRWASSLPKASDQVVKYRWDSSTFTSGGHLNRPLVESVSSKSIAADEYAFTPSSPTEAQRRAVYIEELPEWNDPMMAPQPPLSEVFNPPEESKHTYYTMRPNARSLGHTHAQSQQWEPDMVTKPNPNSTHCYLISRCAAVCLRGANSLSQEERQRKTPSRAEEGHAS
jgi:hypothetical protein